jgi:hypothetical protein
MITYSKTVQNKSTIDGKTIVSQEAPSSNDWANIINTPTTLAGYGITNAYTKTESDVNYEPKDAAIVKSDETETISATWTYSASIISSHASAYISQNPSTTTASITLGWLSNKPRLRVGGSGTGSAGTFEIQGTGNFVRMALTAAGALSVPSTMTASNFIDSSDKRLKKDIKDFCGCKFENVKFKKYKLKKGIDKWQYGVIADELKEVYPNLVHEDDKNYLGVDYRGLTVIGLQRLQEELKNLQGVKKMSLWQLIKWKLLDNG